MTNIKQMAEKDSRLSEPERAMLTEVMPLIDEINEQLGTSIDEIVMVMMVRRLCSRGMPEDVLIDKVLHHYRHQADFNPGGH